MLKATELSPISTFAFFSQILGDWGLLHKYLTLTFTLKFSTKGDASWRCQGRLENVAHGWEKQHLLGDLAFRVKANRAPSRGLKPNPFWATSVPLSNHLSATCHRCAQRVLHQQSSCCDRQAEAASLQGQRGGQGAAAGATAQSATTPGQHRLMAGK